MKLCFIYSTVHDLTLPFEGFEFAQERKSTQGVPVFGYSISVTHAHCVVYVITARSCIGKSRFYSRNRLGVMEEDNFEGGLYQGGGTVFGKEKNTNACDGRRSMLVRVDPQSMTFGGRGPPQTPSLVFFASLFP